MNTTQRIPNYFFDFSTSEGQASALKARINLALTGIHVAFPSMLWEVEKGLSNLSLHFVTVAKEDNREVKDLVLEWLDQQVLDPQTLTQVEKWSILRSQDLSRVYRGFEERDPTTQFESFEDLMDLLLFDLYKSEIRHIMREIEENL